MWKRGTRIGACVLVVAAAGCGHSTDDAAQQPTTQQPTTQPPTPSTEELFVGECGSMTDEQLGSITAVPGLAAVSKNGIRCRWESAASGGAYAMFTWYRGSPIDRERTVAGRIGREITAIDVDGHPGFTAKGFDASCEAGIESGDGFLHWSLNYVYMTPPRDSCAVVEDLARATVENAK
ncbi:DUF3558 domain-containing protein [Rhodococcoides yunnanense]|uniref:DUF3558 domain-containing protein n=1 Tax=Rhodococcoides yunnanense TaxID=278209 RepID=UPI000AF63347|nr:DUF3558 domain-containing protein [Rhodococcus yunnanensis]